MTLAKSFDPETYESRVTRMWERAELFRARPEEGGEPFSLVIPPPNVTGSLHTGHALDYTLQDIVIRQQRMAGRNAVWVPGSDHAGIATQMVVERELERRGESRLEMGREAFLERVWAWKDDYRQRIVDTLKRLGCSCDWSRERFTLDPGFSRAVRETFVTLYEEGLIYRGTRLINWSPALRTSISDLEVDREEPEEGEMWSFAYPIEGGGEIVVATTRPETMLGDTAIAVHPDDERYRELIGRSVEHPFFPDRTIPIVADDVLADPEQGTGAVKVTPAHDFNDFECGRRHDLPQVNILTEDARINENGGEFAGMDRFEAREAVKQALTDRGLYRGSRRHMYTPGRCQRSGVIVEPRLSTQWFLAMEPLAGPALDAVRSGKIEFVPRTWEKTYFHWLENIQDWCISRQLWWGHRIPAWYCRDCGEVTVAREDPDACPSCGSAGIEQDPDVLDTWFSSQLWPFGVFGWPEQTEDLRRYYPTDVLVTGFDIIFFWVARMIMSGLHLAGDVPFRKVLYHGLVRDAQGAKMSKSRGNAIDPKEIMDEHGVDAVRFTLSALASPGSDLSLSENRLAGYRAFLNKLWNAARFLLMRLPGGDGFERETLQASRLDDLDRFLVGSYLELTERVDRAYAEFRYDHACEAIYHFLWNTFCDWSIELSKPDLGDGADPDRARARMTVLVDVLDGTLRLLHPIAPFITEELWQNLPRRAEDPGHLAVARMPGSGDPVLPLPTDFDAQAARERVERWLIAPVSGARTLRSEAGIAPSAAVRLRLLPRQDGGREAMESFADRIAVLARAEEVHVLDGRPPDEPSLRHVLETVEVVIPMAGALDIDKERERLTREKKKLEKDLAACGKKLGNPSFVEKAPEEVVAKEREKQASLEARLGQVDELLGQLS
jgi:valyl-tRNA synthetase